ncbi:MAG: branched-chain amino acid transport system II carrier protein [Oscillospiraceae bacterium]|nr:branched-chain amino acid transport system II carrier protein [Oscillospiraceae bacterium]
MKKHSLKDAFVYGFAAFAMFFGAGNLIFPAGIGAAAGTRWPIALLAVTLGEIVIPLIALVVSGRTGEGFMGVCRPIGKWFYNFVFLFMCLFVVILANLPRTAAVTHEISIAPFFPRFPIWVTVTLYFAVVLFLALDKNNLVDRIGKYMTPILLVLMLIIIVKGFITPIGVAQPTETENVFGSSFIEMYYTGDIYSGLMFSGLIIAAAMSKGYSTEKERSGIMLKAALVAGVAFFVVYGGLLVIGANANGVLGTDMDRTALLVGITEHLLGTAGKLFLAVAVAFACVSTAVSLVSMCGDFFVSLFREKVSYKLVVIVICAVGIVIGSFGVENIINFAAPAFLTVFPAGIVLTIVSLLGKLCPNKGAYKYSVLAALVCGVVDGLSALGVPGVSALTSWLPLASAGFAWVVPSVVFFCVGWLKYKFFPAKG